MPESCKIIPTVSKKTHTLRKTKRIYLNSFSEVANDDIWSYICKETEDQSDKLTFNVDPITTEPTFFNAHWRLTVRWWAKK